MLPVLKYMVTLLLLGCLSSIEVELNQAFQDELAAAKLLDLTLSNAVHKTKDSPYLRRLRHVENELYRNDEYGEQEEQDNLDTRHFYDITIPNDNFRIHDEGPPHERSHHFGDAHTTEGDPHPVVQGAMNMETNVNSLMASANNLKLESVQLQSKAAELEKAAELLHAKAGGPVVHSMDTPVAEHEVSTLHEHQEDTKCCNHGEGPERGGYSARPVVEGQTLPGGVVKAPATPTLGPPTYEKDSPIKEVNSGFPTFNLPPKTGNIPILNYNKPLPPLFGANPYEVLTSSSLNGTAYKMPAFHSMPTAFTQKYIISLKQTKPWNGFIHNTENVVTGNSRTVVGKNKNHKQKTKHRYTKRLLNTEKNRKKQKKTQKLLQSRTKHGPSRNHRVGLSRR